MATYTREAEISLNALLPVDRGRVEPLLKRLEMSPMELMKSGEARKLAIPGSYYTLRATPGLRIIFRVTNDAVEVLDVCPNRTRENKR